MLPPKTGGETPLCDFRKVYDDLDPKMRDTWEKNGLRYWRNYHGPNSSNFDPNRHKSWKDVFETTDKDQVERRCKKEEYSYKWSKEHFLHLENERPAVASHPITGRKVWFNQAHNFHTSGQYAEYWQFLKYLGRDRIRNLWLLVISFIFSSLKFFLLGREKDSNYCSFSDGTPIPLKDLRAVRTTIWKNMKIFKWQRGDMVLIDNLSISHGRLPFSGPRSILVCMSED